MKNLSFTDIDGDKLDVETLGSEGVAYFVTSTNGHWVGREEAAKIIRFLAKKLAAAPE